MYLKYYYYNYGTISIITVEVIVTKILLNILAVSIVVIAGCGGGSAPVQTGPATVTGWVDVIGSAHVTTLNVYTQGHLGNAEHLVATVPLFVVDNKFEFVVPEPGVYDLEIEFWYYDYYVMDDTYKRVDTAMSFLGKEVIAPKTDLGRLEIGGPSW